MASKTQSSSKKIFEKDDRILSSDSEDSLYGVCDTCGIKFSDVKSYKSHMDGKKHQKAVTKQKYLAKRGETEEKSESDDENDASGEMYCVICDKYTSGVVSYMTHLKGKTHSKNVKKEKLKEEMKDMPEVLPKENVEDGEVFARCDLCKKEFTGPESLKAHMKSSSHKKKIHQSKIVENLKEEYKDESKSNNEEYSCDICQKSFTGPVPYTIHMKSKIHNKNVEKAKIAEEFKEFCCIGENGTEYVCKQCKKTFTDPAAFKNHEKTNSHKKLEDKTALIESINSHAEITVGTPPGDENQEDNNNIAGEGYCMSCEVCNVAFSGPKCAQQHVKSKKHINLLKAQKFKKLLKEKDRQGNDSSKLNGEKGKHFQNAKVTEMPNVRNGDAVNGGTSNRENLHSTDDFEFV